MQYNYEQWRRLETNVIQQNTGDTRSYESTEGEGTRPQSTDKTVSLQIIWKSVISENTRHALLTSRECNQLSRRSTGSMMQIYAFIEKTR